MITVRITLDDPMVGCIDVEERRPSAAELDHAVHRALATVKGAVDGHRSASAIDLEVLAEDGILVKDFSSCDRVNGERQ